MRAKYFFIIVPIMKFIPIIILLSVSFLVAADSLRVSAPLPDSIALKLSEKQKIELLNTRIAKMKSIAECFNMQNATAEEKNYCRDRYQILHPEEFDK